MKDVKLWLKKIQESESFAQKYKGLDNVKLIMKQAKKDGYNINKEDLENVDLKKIAGGALNLRIVNQQVGVNVDASGKNATAINNSTITMQSN